jgi:hypothetical protein
MMAGSNTRYGLAEKAGGTAYGGVVVTQAFVKKIRLPDRIDKALMSSSLRRTT